MTQVRTRVIHLDTPLEVSHLGTVHKPFPATYRVTAVRIDHDGNLDAVAYDWVGLSLGAGPLRRTLAQETVRVLGLEKTLDRRRRTERRRSSFAGLIPDVWGLRFRAVG